MVADALRWSPCTINRGVLPGARGRPAGERTVRSGTPLSSACRSWRRGCWRGGISALASASSAHGAPEKAGDYTPLRDAPAHAHHSLVFLLEENGRTDRVDAARVIECERRGTYKEPAPTGLTRLSLLLPWRASWVVELLCAQRVLGEPTSALWVMLTDLAPHHEELAQQDET